jgi:hypothetical protein
MSYRPLLPFKPYAAATQARTVSTSSARAALPASTTQVMLSTVAGDSICFVELGDSSVIAVVPSGATLGGTPINGAAQVFGVPLNATHVAVITASGTATLYITPAEGM